MALTNCPNCTKQVATVTATCPHCGYKIKSPSRLLVRISIAVTLMAISYGLGAFTIIYVNTLTTNAAKPVPSIETAKKIPSDIEISARVNQILTNSSKALESLNARASQFSANSQKSEKVQLDTELLRAKRSQLPSSDQKTIESTDKLIGAKIEEKRVIDEVISSVPTGFTEEIAQLKDAQVGLNSASEKGLINKQQYAETTKRVSLQSEKARIAFNVYNESISHYVSSADKMMRSIRDMDEATALLHEQLDRQLILKELERDKLDLVRVNP